MLSRLVAYWARGTGTVPSHDLAGHQVRAKARFMPRCAARSLTAFPLRGKDTPDLPHPRAVARAYVATPSYSASVRPLGHVPQFSAPTPLVMQLLPPSLGMYAVGMVCRARSSRPGGSRVMVASGVTWGRLPGT